MAELKEKDIKRGALIWYSGTKSMGGWDCPARIEKVDRKKRVFWVMSLDDMQVQSQDYDFMVTEHSPASRKSMRPASLEEARAYLVQQEREIAAQASDAKAYAWRMQEKLKRFRAKKRSCLRR